MWGLIASIHLGNIAGLIIVLTCVPLFALILRVSFSIIALIIGVICAIGAYTAHAHGPVGGIMTFAVILLLWPLDSRWRARHADAV